MYKLSIPKEKEDNVDNSTNNEIIVKIIKERISQLEFIKNKGFNKISTAKQYLKDVPSIEKIDNIEVDYIEENDDVNITLIMYDKIIRKKETLIYRQKQLKFERNKGYIECKTVQNCLSRIYGRFYEFPSYISSYHVRDPIVLVITVSHLVFINIDTQEILYTDNEFDYWNYNYIVKDDLILFKQGYGLFFIDFNCEPQEVYKIPFNTEWAFLNIRYSNEIIAHTSRPGSSTNLCVDKRSKSKSNLYKSVEARKTNGLFKAKYRKNDYDFTNQYDNLKYIIIQQIGKSFEINIHNVDKINEPLIEFKDGYNGFSNITIYDNKIKYKDANDKIKELIIEF